MSAAKSVVERKTRRGVVSVDMKRFAEVFIRVFGRLPTRQEFEEWCTAWRGRLEKDKCIFPHVEV
jgi:hypothetical protein